MGGQLGRQPGGQSVGRLFSKDIDIIKVLCWRMTITRLSSFLVGSDQGSLLMVAAR